MVVLAFAYGDLWYCWQVQTSSVIDQSFALDTVNTNDSCHIKDAQFDQAWTLISHDVYQQSVNDRDGMARYQTVRCKPGLKVNQNGGQKFRVDDLQIVDMDKQYMHRCVFERVSRIQFLYQRHSERNVCYLYTRDGYHTEQNVTNTIPTDTCIHIRNRVGIYLHMIYS